MINEFDNERPIYLQIVEDIKLQIISAKLLSNDKLPSVRELALQYKVNPNTIQKSMQALEDEKLIYTESTNGKFVTKNIEIIKNIKYEYTKKETGLFLKKMSDAGISYLEVIDYLNKHKGE